MGIHRSHLARRDRMDARATRARNKVRKGAETRRRDARMLTRIKTGGLPHTPEVMSWLSRKLGKPARRITPTDLGTLTG